MNYKEKLKTIPPSPYWNEKLHPVWDYYVVKYPDNVCITYKGNPVTFMQVGRSSCNTKSYDGKEYLLSISNPEAMEGYKELQPLLDSVSGTLDSYLFAYEDKDVHIKYKMPYILEKLDEAL